MSLARCRLRLGCLSSIYIYIYAPNLWFYGETHNYTHIILENSHSKFLEYNEFICSHL